MRHQRDSKRVLKKIGFAFMGLAFFALVIFVTMLLWNWLIPEIFHGPVITYWQALGLLLLGKLLFGWHNHQRGFGPWGQRGQWKEKIKERMANMSPEQRERMKEHLRNHCGPGRFNRWNNHADPFDEQDETHKNAPEKEKDSL
ncbi:hypothetical protein [Chitinophaga sp. MM2321]|uniref:hypothetical protein n=1 Tax=Chitinophaga sp. MM2321 TaxID=3137178 RepID=UPI0032D57A4C